MKTTQFISKWQKMLPEANRSEFELDVYKYLTSEEPAKPELNHIEKAYEEGKKIRVKLWGKYSLDGWIKKHSEMECLSDSEIIYLKYKFGDFKQNPEDWELYPEPEAQPEPVKPEMGYHQKAKYIIDNKLTHKDASVKNCFVYAYYGCVFYFCDENGKDMFSTSFFTIDLSEWHPYKPKFDRNRFEAMFRAKMSETPHTYSFEWYVKETEEMLQQLDAYYASKEGK